MPSSARKKAPDSSFAGSLDHETFALLFGGNSNNQGSRRIPAEAWFDRSEAHHFDVFEETFQVPKDQICTVLLLNDPKMLRD